jgi:hypothetical protein
VTSVPRVFVFKGGVSLGSVSIIKRRWKMDKNTRGAIVFMSFLMSPFFLYALESLFPKYVPREILVHTVQFLGMEITPIAAAFLITGG